MLSDKDLRSGEHVFPRCSPMFPAAGGSASGIGPGILAVREIRVELGEPSERTALSIEDTIKREYERWMVVEGEDEGSAGGTRCP